PNGGDTWNFVWCTSGLPYSWNADLYMMALPPICTPLFSIFTNAPGLYTMDVSSIKSADPAPAIPTAFWLWVLTWEPCANNSVGEANNKLSNNCFIVIID